MTYPSFASGHMPPTDILARFRVAQTMRQNWESLWRECRDYTQAYTPQPFGGMQKNTKLFDGTAGNAVDLLASSLLAQLTPPWSSWIGLTTGPLASDEEREFLAPILNDVNEIIQGHFDRSNFAVEMHQAFFDLVTYGTACLRFDETDPGELSAFNFQSMPLNDMYFLDGIRGQMDACFSIISMSDEELQNRFPHMMDNLPPRKTGDDTPHKILYAAIPQNHGGYILSFILDHESGTPIVLDQFHSATSPFIGFRWQKSAGDLYGRSPVMKALPDIKTANAVVELILKNASIAVTGIWLADDDGILNPANIKLTPGAIIPKAVGSSGLTPLKMPGNFDISQLVLGDLRQKIQHALLGDTLQNQDKRMTATEVLARQDNLIQHLGATYGRLQGELLTPLALRAFDILRVRGEIPDLHIDGRKIMIDYRSPLARAQSQRDVQATLTWLQTATQYDKNGDAFLNMPETLHYLARALGVPQHLLATSQPQNPAVIPLQSPAE